jgi:hypothetical protein
MRLVLVIKINVTQKYTGKRLLLTGTTFRFEVWNQTEIWSNEAATYYHARFYHGHLISPSKIIDILSQRQFISLTFYQSEN